MNKIKLIIAREFFAKVKSKSFAVLTFLSPILMLAMFGLIFYLTSDGETINSFQLDKNDIVNGVKGIVGIGSGYLVMMFVIIYGNAIMRSILEEKNSRIVEIIVSSVKPYQLLLGKIIGNALAGITQFIIWAAILLIGIFAYSQVLGVSSTDTSDAFLVIDTIFTLPILKMVTVFIIYFVGGYFLYSAFYATIGASVNSETDTQQFIHPVLIPLMFAVYIGIAMISKGEINGSTATFFSIFPLTSPIVMLMRIPFGVPVWQLLVSMALLLFSFLITVAIASKIYKIGILSYGNKPSIKQIVKWMLG